MSQNVKIGDFEFDPVEPQDFWLNVEGASKTGKSNTIAVIMEDLDRKHGDVNDEVEK